MRKTRFILFFVTAGLLGANQFAGAADPVAADKPIVSPADALSRLKEGNERYTSGKQQHPRQSSEERTQLSKSQHPFAIAVGCADSRIPPEIVFDQGLGDLFVCRVAGNVIDDHSLGSIEYAVDHLGVRLIVVLPARSGSYRQRRPQNNRRGKRQKCCTSAAFIHANTQIQS